MTENQSSWGKVFFIVSSSESADTFGEWKGIKGSEFSFKLLAYTPVTNIDDVRQAISEAAKVQDSVVHFSGHGGEADKPEFMLEGEFLEPDELSGFFNFKGVKNIRCVIFNFCNSSKFAEKVSKHVECAIGIDGAIASKAAIDFAQGFYGYLSDREPGQPSVFNDAFEAAKNGSVGDDRQKFKIFSNPETRELEVKLKEPTEGSSIPRECECSGTFRNLPENSTMWLYVEATLQRKFYLVPIEKYSINKGTWEKKNFIVGEPEDKNDYRVGVIVADEKVNNDLNRTLRREGIVCLDNLPSGTKEFGDRPVTRM